MSDITTTYGGLGVNVDTQQRPPRVLLNGPRQLGSTSLRCLWDPPEPGVRDFIGSDGHFIFESACASPSRCADGILSRDRSKCASYLLFLSVQHQLESSTGQFLVLMFGGVANHERVAGLESYFCRWHGAAALSE